MVYCGKPSKGCGQCRSRKIRCDQARPTCSQCAKANRVCPGYRDELSLMFRDESQMVVRKAKTGSSRSKSRTSKESSRTSSPNSSPNSVPQAETEPLVLEETFDFNVDPQQELIQQITRGPLVTRPSFAPTEFEAVCFFTRYNTWPGAFWSLSSMPNLFVSEGTPSQQAMKASIISVGTAMLSRVTKSEPLKLLAERQYGSALKLTNSALSNEVDAKENSTLATVIILALFEVNTSRAPRSIENWTNHIQGAATLLGLRGPEQLQTPAGLQLFLQLRFQIIVSCLQKATYVPKSLLECTKASMFLRPLHEAYGDRLINICGKLANLRADINYGILTDESDALSAAYAIEAELIAWLAAIPSNFAYATVECESVDSSFKDRCRGLLPYENRYHLYRSYWICNIWNQYRSARIITNQIILGYMDAISGEKPFSSLPDDLQAQFTKISDTIHELSVDVCASVPYHFGVGEMEGSIPGMAPQTESFIGGYILLWPLSLAGMTGCKGDPMRRWAADCLKLIGHSMGIDQALALADIMESDEYFTPRRPQRG